MNNTQRHNSDKRVIRTKRSIRNALFKLMECKNIEDISISELTANANVNRRTFYTHYRNITDILDEIEAELVQALTEMLATADYSNYRKSVATQFIGFYNLISNDYDDYFHLLKIDSRGILVSRLRSAIKESAETIFSSLPHEIPASSVYAASFVAGGFLAFFSEWYYSEERLPIESAADIVGRMAEGCISAV